MAAWQTHAPISSLEGAKLFIATGIFAAFEETIITKKWGKSCHVMFFSFIPDKEGGWRGGGEKGGDSEGEEGKGEGEKDWEEGRVKEWARAVDGRERGLVNRL